MVDPGSKVMGAIWMAAGILLVLVRRPLARAWLRDFDAPEAGHRRMRAIIVAVAVFLVVAGAVVMLQT